MKQAIKDLTGFVVFLVAKGIVSLPLATLIFLSGRALLTEMGLDTPSWLTWYVVTYTWLVVIYVYGWIVQEIRKAAQP